MAYQDYECEIGNVVIEWDHDGAWNKDLLPGDTERVVNAARADSAAGKFAYDYVMEHAGNQNVFVWASWCLRVEVLVTNARTKAQLGVYAQRFSGGLTTFRKPVKVSV